jgi:hypothetical protein
LSPELPSVIAIRFDYTSFSRTGKKKQNLDLAPVAFTNNLPFPFF